MNDKERDELLIKLAGIVERLQEDVEKIMHVLIDGNGKPPLTEQVLRNTIDLDRLKEERADKKLPRAAWISIAVSIGIGLLGLASSL